MTIFIGSFLLAGEFIGDFNVFWEAGRIPVDLIYSRYYFSYPPTALPLLHTFGILPFWWSYAAWTLLQAAALFMAARRIANYEAITFGFLTGAVLSCLLGGQASLFTAALLILGITEKDPRLGALFLAAAGVFKPQVAVGLPIALLACRDYRRFLWTGVFAIILVMLTVLTWGLQSWLEWFAGLNKFVAYLDARGINYQDVGMHGLALKLGLPPWLYLLGIPLGVAVLWSDFSADGSAIDRYVALTVGGILLSPYTLSYDLAGPSVACAALLFDRERSVIRWLGAACVASMWLANIGVLILASVILWERRALSGRNVGAPIGEPLSPS